MEQRSFDLDVTIISAKDLNNVNFITKMDVYAVVFISGNIFKRRIRTPVDKDGGSNPTWNFRVKFRIDKAAAHAQQNGLSLVLKLKSERVFGDKEIGEVRVPVKELLDSPGLGNGKQFVSYQVRKPDGEPKGFISFSYQFNEKPVKVNEPVMGYPPPAGMVGTSSYSYPPQQNSEVYPPPHAHGAPVAGYAPRRTLHNRRRVIRAGALHNRRPPQEEYGMGLGAGLLGGMLLGAMVSDAGFDF